METTDLVEQLDAAISEGAGQLASDCRDHITALQARVAKLEELVEKAYQEGFADGVDGGDPAYLDPKPFWERSHSRAALAEDYCGIVEVNEEDFTPGGPHE